MGCAHHTRVQQYVYLENPHHVNRGLRHLVIDYDLIDRKGHNYSFFCLFYSTATHIKSSSLIAIDIKVI